jgi:hypothetical protein
MVITTTSTMTDTTIRLLFIRKNSSSKNDDRVTIRRLGANQFNLSYTYGESKSKTAHKLVLTDRAVFRWVRNVIGLLEKDNDPFDSVQVDFPFMPTVLFDVSKLGDAYHAFLDALEFHLDNWPAPAPAPAAEAETEDEDEDEDEQEDMEMEEDEYADMPPLIPSPINQNNSSYFNNDNDNDNTIYNGTRGRHHLFLD